MKVNERKMVACLSATAIALILACSDLSAPPDKEATRSPEVSVREAVVPLSSLQQQRPADSSLTNGSEASTSQAVLRFSAARARTAWIGQVHNDGLKEFMRRKPKNRRLSPNEVCATIAASILAQLPNIERFSGLARPMTESRRSVFSAITHTVKQCESASESSIFGSAPIARSRAIVDTEPDVTSAFESYANGVGSAVGGSRCERGVISEWPSTARP
jgi:hypothetical protein